MVSFAAVKNPPIDILLLQKKDRRIPDNIPETEGIHGGKEKLSGQSEGNNANAERSAHLLGEEIRHEVIQKTEIKETTVLLIGGGSRFMDAMIDIMKKNGHQVYLLTGRRDKRFSYKHVFEQYNFEYDTDSIEDIFKSIMPELTIFRGAFDTNFDWKTARKESVRYTTALTNILSVCSMSGKGRFVYLSSYEVYSSIHGADITEDMPTEAQGFKALALAHGEEICDSYRTAHGMDTLVLRFDHMYGIPRKGEKQDDPCFKMCLEALKTGKISASCRNVYSMIYLKDAIEYAYKAIVDAKPAYRCYHISSMEEISEMQLAEMIQKYMDGKTEIADNSVGEKHRLVLDGNRYQEEYHMQVFFHYDAGVQKVVQYMKRHREAFMKDEDSGGSQLGKFLHNVRLIIKKLIPFIENCICFIPFFMLNNRAVGSEYFSRLDFYLLYVLLFAIVHGQQQALISAALSVAGYCFRQMYERTGFEVLLDYNTYVWIAQLFILGMVVGYMRDQLKYIKEENQENVDYLHGKLSDIDDINDSNIRMKQSFEMQVMNQKDSLGKIYEITSRLDAYAPEEVLFYAAEMLSKLMDSKDVAIYTVANGDYARLFSATSKEARKLGSSIKYTSMESLYDEIKERRVYINKTLEAQFPLMASAVYAADQMQLILMVWGIPWQRMTLAEANRLTVVGALIQNTVVRANRYLDALKDQRYVGETNVLDEKAFTQLVKAFFEAREKGLTECSLLEISGVREYNRKEAARVLATQMRQTDYLGLIQGSLYVLLSNTDQESAKSVIERFLAKGYRSELKGEAA